MPSRCGAERLPHGWSDQATVTKTSNEKHHQAGKMEAAATAVALGATGLFSGGVLFISAIVCPAMPKFSYKAFYDYFCHTYPRGFMLQGSFLFMGVSAAAIAAAKEADQQNKRLWFLSSGLLFAIFPYTMLAHMPITKKIMRQDEKDPAKLPALQRRWGRLHHGRTLLSLSALAVMLAAVVRGSGASS